MKNQLVRTEPVSLTVQSLSEHGKQILELLGAGRPPSAVAEAVGVSRPSMSYWVNKLKQLGFLRLCPQSVAGSWNYYELTQKGSKVLTGSEEDTSVIVLEDYPVKFDVVSWGRADDCVSWEKLGEPRNWVKLGFKLGEVRVVRTSKSVIVHPGRLRGDNSWNLVFVASQECNRVARWLEQKTGLMVRPGQPIKRPCFQVYDCLSEQLTRKFSFKNEDGMGADRSPPAKKGHWELGPEAANDFIKSSSRLKQVTHQMHHLGTDLEKLDTNLEKLENGLLPALNAWTKVGQKLLKVLSKLDQIEELEQLSASKAKEDNGGYIW